MSECQCRTPKLFTVTDETFEGLFSDEPIHTTTFTVCDACGADIRVGHERGHPDAHARRHRHNADS